ncbi:MAG TPA: hypothetical protein VNZ27_00900 [Rhodanobacter sp.]|jgi:hypothetical protein|nr:hypothetical protein [Rhodanobacter sp.]
MHKRFHISCRCLLWTVTVAIDADRATVSTLTRTVGFPTTAQAHGG